MEKIKLGNKIKDINEAKNSVSKDTILMFDLNKKIPKTDITKALSNDGTIFVKIR